MSNTFRLLEQLLDHDLACLVSMHVLLSGSTKTKALEGRYRRDVQYLSRNTLYFTDLMKDDGPRNVRTPEGLLKWSVDSKEYLPSTCRAPAGAVIYPVYQVHSDGLRVWHNLPPDWHSGVGLDCDDITRTPPFPPVPWHKVAATPRFFGDTSGFQVREAWGMYDD